jgi:hypothetical protein
MIGAFFVQTTGDQKLLDMMTLLAAGVTFTISIPASGPEFQGYSGGVLGALSGPIDHCTRCIDYQFSGTALQFDSFVSALRSGDTATSAALATYLTVICVNSWGTWGTALDVPEIGGGLFLGNRAFVDQLADPCALKLAPFQEAA